MYVRDMFSADTITVAPDVEFPALVQLFAERPQRIMHVVDAAGKLLGVISSFELLGLLSPGFVDANLAKALPADYDERAVCRSYTEHRCRTAKEIMRADVQPLRPDDHYLRVETLMRQQGITVLPVVDDGGLLLGEISLKKVLRYLAGVCRGNGEHCQLG